MCTFFETLYNICKCFCQVTAKCEVCSIQTHVCSSTVICVSHYKQSSVCHITSSHLCVTLQAWSSVCHITSTVICVSHYNHDHLCVTLQAVICVSHYKHSHLCVTLQAVICVSHYKQSSVCHITTMIICVSHYKHGHLCVTLQPWSYVCHITSTVIRVSHYNHDHMCVTLPALSFVCHMTSTVICVTWQAQSSVSHETISMGLEDLFCSFIVLPVHPYFYPSIFVFTRPNDGSLHKAMIVLVTYYIVPTLLFVGSFQLVLLRVPIFLVLLWRVFTRVARRQFLWWRWWRQLFLWW